MSTKDLSIAAQASLFGELLRGSRATGRGNEPCDLEDALSEFCTWLMDMVDSRRSQYLIGNGGSASVASHAATDFFNVAGLRAMTLHESSLLTCMTNDYGYENAFSRMLAQVLHPGDLVVAISSSGQSMNIRNASLQAKRKGARVVTLSGFDSSNPLRAMGELNFWISSHDYGMVEIGHQFLLHNVSDRLRDRLSGCSHDQ